MAEIGMKRPKKAPRWIRLSVQAFFFILVALIATTGALAERGIPKPTFLEGASLHAICPFGGVVSFWQLVTTGTLVKKVHESSVALAVIALFLAVLFGPVICGWVCPFGSLQEWVGRLGRRIWKKRYNSFMPVRLDRWLRYLRYLVLAWVIYMTAVTGKIFFQDYDPYFALFNFWTGEAALGGFLVLGLTVILSLFVERPFCKYACPYGAFQSIFNLFRIFGIRRQAATCIDCKACDRACPMDIRVSTSGIVRDHQCVSCLRCASEDACPVDRTVELGAGGVSGAPKDRAARLPVRTVALAVITVVAVFGGVYAAKALDYWKTTSAKQPVKFKDGELAGLPNPADIRGSYSWLDIERAFGVPAAEAARAFSPPGKPLDPAGRVSALEELYLPIVPEGMEIGTGAVRLFVSLYTGLPLEAEEGTALPDGAIAYLSARPGADKAAIARYAIPGSPSANPGPAAPPEAAAPSQPAGQADGSAVPRTVAGTVAGKTTFGDLYGWGLSEEQVRKAIGYEPGPRSQSVRDSATAAGKDFSELKATLQALLDAKK